MIETFSQTRYFIYFMLMVTCMGSLTLGLLLFDVHTVIDYPPDMDYSSEMLLLDEKYEQTATGTIDLWYNFGDIFRSFHSTIDIFFFGTKSDAVESALLEVPPRIPPPYLPLSHGPPSPRGAYLPISPHISWSALSSRCCPRATSRWASRSSARSCCSTC